MRGARRLYWLHIAVGGLGIGLLAASSALIFAHQRFEIPSSQAIAGACGQWLSTGGPVSLLGLAIALLTVIALGVAVASACRQVRVSRRYLASRSIGAEEIEVEGVGCRLIASAEPQAFCAGYLRPTIYLSEGIREELEPVELRAVLAHEAHHRRRRDPLRLLAARALADALFFVPVLRRISERYATLAELAADEAAVRAVSGRGPLASAMLKFSEPGLHPPPVVSIAPERVDHLLGRTDGARWELSLSALVRSALALAALASVSLLVWGGVLHPGPQVSLLALAACGAMMVCGPIALAGGALLISRGALAFRRC